MSPHYDAVTQVFFDAKPSVGLVPAQAESTFPLQIQFFIHNFFKALQLGSFLFRRGAPMKTDFFI
jgi:hypothetical protein